jgi:DNA-binding transcriptional ArsR family regulator
MGMSSAYQQHQLPALQALDALASSERRLLLWLLRDRPLRVSELTRLSGLSQPSVSKHLRVLHQVGLVTSGGDWRDRRLRIYHLHWQPFLEVERWLADMRGARYGGTPYEPSRELEEQLVRPPSIWSIRCVVCPGCERPSGGV